MSTDALPPPDLLALPDDPAVLKQLIAQLLEELQKERGARDRLEHHLHLLLKRLYGSSSEKFDPQQGVLFDPGQDEAAASVPPPAASATPKHRHRHGRGRIPDETQREEAVHDLTDAEKAILGGAENLIELPPETSEQLDWRPSTLFVIVHVRKKYARKELLPESGLTLAEHESRRLDAIRMETALAWIGKLYAVEKELRQRCAREWQSLSLEERAARIAAERQERSRPLLDAFHAWLEAEAHSPQVLPKSAVRGAIDYTLSNWTALTVYLQDGWLDIDNNEGENSLRGLCLGRKNWLFLGSDRGGRAAAVHFSLLASCKRHGHDPWVYYRDVLVRLPALLPGASDEDLLALLPHRWQPA